jgi:hypothetical protein
MRVVSKSRPLDLCFFPCRLILSTLVEAATQALFTGVMCAVPPATACLGVLAPHKGFVVWLMPNDDLNLHMTVLARM